MSFKLLTLIFIIITIVIVHLFIADKKKSWLKSAKNKKKSHVCIKA